MRIALPWVCRYKGLVTYLEAFQHYARHVTNYAEAFWHIKQKIGGKIFADEVKSTKTMKVFPLESFAIYGNVPRLKMVYATYTVHVYG